MKINELSLEFVNENFYESDEKVLRKDGKKCSNNLDTKGYFRFQFKNKTYKSHRILWILRNQKEIPEGYIIDHVDGNPSNNSNQNLRLATQSENIQNSKISRNNKTGYKGIHITIIKNTKYYITIITKNKKNVSKKFPYTKEGLESAKEWLEIMRKELHGEFARNE